MTACDDRSPVEREDDRAQQGVLGILLHIHPGQYSIDEVIREMTAEPDTSSPATTSRTRSGTS
jgi:hypothetical protein